jgi:hypothetical protein
VERQDESVHGSQFYVPLIKRYAQDLRDVKLRQSGCVRDALPLAAIRPGMVR